MPTHPSLGTVFVIAIAGVVRAQTPTGAPTGGSATEPARKAPAEPFPNLGLLVRDDDAKVLNELWFLGRYHGQYHWADGTDDNAEGYESRRVRIGGQARMFQNLVVHAQAISGSDFDPSYNGFTELWAGWRFSDAVMVTVGQQKHRFTHDRNVSSRYLNYLERSQLTNMFAADYTPAVTLSGRSGKWSYYGGLFSNRADRDMWDAFTDLDSGQSTLATVTYDLGTSLRADSAFLNVSGVQSDTNANATNLNYFDTGIASALILTHGSASLVTEVTSGLGNDRGDAYGINLQPGWFLTDQLQAVARYQFAHSDGETGLRAQRRYERDVGMTTGDEYQAAYFGLNHHFAGHRMKLMAGVEWSSLGGEECWTASVMFRVFWGPHSRGPFPMGDTLPGTF